jgi:Na+-translocating ferredoxin:NAD+ oxidoreductase RnfE subunit
VLGTGKITVFSQAGIDVTIIPLSEGTDYLFKFVIDPPGAFVCLGAILMVMNIISARSAKAA